MHIDNDNVLQLSINALRHHCNNENNITGVLNLLELTIKTLLITCFILCSYG